MEKQYLNDMFDLYIMAAIETCFTQDQQCAPLIVKRIEQAKQTILMQCYGFNLESLKNALLSAANRGVKVLIIADKSHEQKASILNDMKSPNISIYIDNQVAIAHNKVIIIDGKTLIVGSYNWTNSAEHDNAENLVFIEKNKVIDSYIANWYARQKASKAFGE